MYFILMTLLIHNFLLDIIIYFQMRLALHYKNNTDEYEDHVLEELRLHELDEDEL